MSSNSPTDCSKLILPNLDLIASETELVIRKSRKFTPDGFLQSLLSSVVTGLASFNQIAGDLKDRVDAAMSPQSLHERLTHKSTAFLLATHNALIEQRYAPSRPALEKSHIKRLVVEDASGQVMPKSNAQIFPAHGNHHGPTAGVKIDFAYDLLSGEAISHSLQRATTQDKVIGQELLIEVQKNDLVLRDMGYFVLAEFTAIEARGAWWLTRLPLTTNVSLENGDALEKLLSSSKSNTLDLGVIVGEEGKAARLVAVRASAQITESRRRERRKKAKELGKTASQKSLTRDGWHLMLTNLPATEASVVELAEIYRARWAVEIQFRGWKQSLNLEKALNRKSNKHHMEALVLAGMIAHQLGLKMAQFLTGRIGRALLSYEKLYDLLANLLIKSPSFTQLSAFSPDPRHITRDKRRRKSPVESGLQALT